MRIFFIDTVHPILWQLLVAAGHECVDVTGAAKSDLLLSMAGVHGIVIRSRFRIDREFIDASQDLKFIARSGAGMENIDTPYAEDRGIRCINSPEGNRVAVGEHAIGMLLMLFNRLNRADLEVRSGQWNREANRGIELCGKTIGIVGYGRMGSAFAKNLSGFGCRVLAYDKYLDRLPDTFAELVDWEEFCKQVDVVSLHVPLTDETTYLADATFFNGFQKPIWIINTARGKCLRLADLAAALETGKVLGACLDVLEYEDVSFEKFSLADESFASLPEWKMLRQDQRVVFSPHIAGWTVESYRKLSAVLFEKIQHDFRF